MRGWSNKRLMQRRIALAGLACLCFCGVAPPAANALSLRLRVVHGLPRWCEGAEQTTLASDGALWVACEGRFDGRETVRDIRISPQGQITASYAKPASIFELIGGVPGQGDFVWYAGLRDGHPFARAWCRVSAQSGLGCVSLKPPLGSRVGSETVGPTGNLDLLVRVGPEKPGDEKLELDELTSGTLREIRHQLPASTQLTTLIVAAANGDLWTAGKSSLVRISPSFQVTTFGVPATFGYPEPLLVVPNGDVLFGSSDGDDEPGREAYMTVTPGGSESPIAVAQDAIEPVLGPEGDLWVLAWRGPGTHTTITGELQKVSPEGSVRSFPLRGGSVSRRLAFGLGGRLWAESTTDQGIDTVSPAGVVSRVSLPPGTWRLGAVGRHALWLTGSDGPLSHRHLVVAQATLAPLEAPLSRPGLLGARRRLSPPARRSPASRWPGRGRS